MFHFYPVLLVCLSIVAVRSAAEPAPIVVGTTGKFSGNDGSWSTFNFSVGTPFRNLELLPSTQVPESWIVLDVACTDRDPANCSDSRGGTFDFLESSSWENKSFYALGAEANLGYSREYNRGFYAKELVQLTNPEGANTTVNHSVVAGIITPNFYLGVLGLAARPVVWEDQSDSSDSLITILKKQNLIPNLSYGYTAGASYRSAPGSLTIGGYDASRLTPNDVSFALSPQTARQLLVSIQAISVTNSNGPSQLLTQGNFALIDSTVPHLWLPTEACQAFEDAFGIQFDPITNLYLVDDNQHAAMVEQNAEVTFQLGTSLNGGDIISITLPYASFDLEIGPPFVRSQRKYFPLRRAKDETQFTLGRAFLQEAFIIVDYDNDRFSISQAQYAQGQPSRIVVTSAEDSENGTATDTTPESPVLTKTSSQNSGGIGTGAIAGISAAIIILVLLAGAYCLWRFKFKKSSKFKDNTKDKAELEDNNEPKGVFEAFNKRRLSEESSHDSKNAAKFNVNEVQPTELDGAGSRGGPSNTSMGMEHIAELPSPDPFRPELESPGLDLIRSELSTPEPPSELSTSDRNLVPELASGGTGHGLASQGLTHELPSSARPKSYRNNSIDSDTISPQDSASVRPRVHGRKSSDDTIATPASPTHQRPPLRLSGRWNGTRPAQFRLNSSSSHDTIQSRIDDPSGGNITSLSSPHHGEPYAPRSNSFRRTQGSPSPLASPPLGSQPSPSLSALNSPTFPCSNPRLADNGPPTPMYLGVSSTSAETEPLINENQQHGSRNTRFEEHFASDQGALSGEELEKQRGEEVQKAENPSRREGN
ncbi:MAG: hypothetical protein Q9171_003823 [Xanthocarpia ochracea]